jgi:hypothetical protein
MPSFGNSPASGGISDLALSTGGRGDYNFYNSFLSSRLSPCLT